MLPHLGQHVLDTLGDLGRAGLCCHEEHAQETGRGDDRASAISGWSLPAQPPLPCRWHCSPRRAGRARTRASACRGWSRLHPGHNRAPPIGPSPLKRLAVPFFSPQGSAGFEIFIKLCKIANGFKKFVKPARFPVSHYCAARHSAGAFRPLPEVSCSEVRMEPSTMFVLTMRNSSPWRRARRRAKRQRNLCRRRRKSRSRPESRASLPSMMSMNGWA